MAEEKVDVALESKLEESLKKIESDKLVEQFMVGEAEKTVKTGEINLLVKDIVRAVLKLFWRK